MASRPRLDQRSASAAILTAVADWVDYTVRLPEAAWAYLRQQCERHGLRLWAAVEGGVDAFLDLNEAEPPAPVVAVVWARAGAFERDPGAAGPREKHSLRLNRTALDRAKKACARRDVAVNSLIAAGLTPGGPWGTSTESAAMAACWERAVALARERDWQRQHGSGRGRSEIPDGSSV